MTTALPYIVFNLLVYFSLTYFGVREIISSKVNTRTRCIQVVLVVSFAVQLGVSARFVVEALR